MSGSQKFVFVISILNIIGGAGIVILGIATGVLSSAGDKDTGPIILIAGIVIILLGVFEIIGGAIGIRAARDARKVGLFYAISLISLIFSIISIIATFATTGFQFGTLFSIVLPALMFYCASNIKKQGQGNNGQ